MGKAPIYVRTLTDEEQAALRQGQGSSDAFVVRRCQIVLASASGKWASQVGQDLHCDTDTALNAINAFNQVGVAALRRGSSVPHRIALAFDGPHAEQLRALLHQSPRSFGKETSLWSLALAAEVSFEQGITPVRVSREAVRTALQRLDVRWKRAKHWITSSDPAYAKKKESREVPGRG
jgi:transposase